ncbi:unnamed protein product [Amoebophrya sp. A25]|nr:unnamed protein product [Amoebophrya sp. A25]|eukprot:GSA25T00008611001.1
MVLHDRKFGTTHTQYHPSEAKYASLLPSGTSQKMSTDGPLGTSSGSKFGARFGFETEGRYVKVNGHEVFQYSWPVASPKAILYVAHGNTEHAARYRILAKFLNEHGISVYAHDHLGHGKTAEREGCPLGDTAYEWIQIPKDLQALCFEMLDQNAGRVPFYLMGHSVGTLISQKAVQMDNGALGKRIDGLILSGPVFRPGFVVSCVFLSLVGVFGALLGRHSITKWHNTIERTAVFNEFQGHFKPNKTDFDWLSRDIAEVQEYSDENCGHNMSIHYWAGYFRNLMSVSKDDFSSMDKKPVLVCLGSEDPLAKEPMAPFGPKWKALYQLMGEFKNCEDLRILIHAFARHEPHNDMGKKNVFQNYVDWILSPKFPLSKL